MSTTLRLTLTAVLLAGSVSIASAQTAQDHEAHHPAEQSTQQQPPSQMGGGPQGMMMGGDMTQMMGMMQMMQMMRTGTMPMGMGPATMRPLRHVEGQLAFWKTELKITDAQAPLWNAFADAFRSSAAQFREATTQAPNTAGVVSAPELLERRVATLTAELDAMKPVLAAAKPLYAALSDDQKKTADELTSEHFTAMRGRGL